nr:DNA (cytosine-5-)-methyltransferase [uncultured Pseudodesulfovibrio sp.]
MKFVDLFSGLGGFHVGLSNNGHQCVFACEIDNDLRELYYKNHGILPYEDIRSVDVESIPKHDILCAGFPCQPFSLAGKKKGAKCPKSGKLIDYVVEIARVHSPQFVLLENVPNILTIEEGKFWHYLRSAFKSIGYSLSYKVISPVDFGIPQNRKRVFVVGTKCGLREVGFEWPSSEGVGSSLIEILDDSVPSKPLEPSKDEVLQNWQLLLDGLKVKTLGSLSLVAPEFGATYPHDFRDLSLSEMRKYKGAYGVSLSGCSTWDDVLQKLPAYARKKSQVSAWIKKSVAYSREVYIANRTFCDEWALNSHKKYNSWQILEWRGDRYNHCIDKHLVQFRASGIRVFKPHTAPSLISMTPTQVPIIPSKKRYLSTYEAAKLQHLDTLAYLPNHPREAFKALGNAVNAKIVELITENLRPLTSCTP